MKKFYSFRLDPINRCLWREDQRVPLTPKAFALLNFLVENHGVLVSQSEIFEALWPETYVQPEVLKSHIRDIRKALGDNPRKAVYVETLPRRGYRFLAPVVDPEALGIGKLPLVGRRLEFAQLSAHWAAALQGARRIVFVTGEAGIGKTALLDAFLAGGFRQENSARIARGQCVASCGLVEPYYPFLEALGQLCRSDGGRGVVRLLASVAPAWLAQFPSLARADFSRPALSHAGQTNRMRMPREFCECLEHLTAERPLVLVLEDLHLADDATVELISAIARRRSIGKFLLIATYRPEDTQRAGAQLEVVKRDLLLRDLCEEIELQPFTDEEMGEYVLQSRGVATPELTDLVRRYSEGNPLFASSMLQEALKKSSPPTADAGDGIPEDGVSLEAKIPPALRQHIELRIDNVAGSERRAIEAASVLGVSFITSLAAEVARLDPEIFEDLCEHLVLRGIIQRDGVERLPDGTLTQRFRFRHRLYREVLYRRMSLVRRSRLQERAAHRIESLYAKPLAELASEVARHAGKQENQGLAAASPPLAIEKSPSLPATLHTV